MNFWNPAGGRRPATDNESPDGPQPSRLNRQQHRLARLARRLGKRPSELQATTGASKQREHEERDEDHETKLARRRQGKQASALWRLGRH